MTITADDQPKPSGSTFVFTGTEFTTVGLLNSDTVDSTTLTSAGAAAGAPPGVYPIAISAAVGTGLANYTITYVPGSMLVGNTRPTIGDADITTTATATVSSSVPVSDPDAGQTLTLTITSGPTHGTATVADDGSFSYTPTGTYTGRDTFTIEACDDASVPACADGTVNVAIYPVAVPDTAATTEGKTIEVDVQANDIGDTSDLQIVSGPAHGSATIGSIIYTPNAGFTGTDAVVYRVCSPNDETLCDEATLTIRVDPPVPDTGTQPNRAAPDPTPPWSLPIAFIVLLSVLGGTTLVLRRR